MPIDFCEINLLDRANLDSLIHREHERAYGFSVAKEPTTIVNLKVMGLGDIPKPGLPAFPTGVKEPSADAIKEQREVYFHKSSGMVKCPIFERSKLKTNNRIPGPAIVEEVDSTTVILPDYTGEVDKFGNLLLRNL